MRKQALVTWGPAPAHCTRRRLPVRFSSRGDAATRLESVRGSRAAVTRRACIKLTRIFGQGTGSLAERIHRCGDGQGCENGAEEHLFQGLLQNELFPHKLAKENGWAVVSPPRPTKGYGPGKSAEAVCTVVPEASPG